MVAKKRKSKRQTLQVKYKIIKRTQQHHRRLKKGAMLNSGGKKKKPELSIPSAFPHKEQLLKDIQAAKEKMEGLKQRSKEKRAEEVRRRRTGEPMLEDKPRNVLSAPQPEFEEEVEEDDGDMDLKQRSVGQNSRRAYLKELRKVVGQADVILHVLDARDPDGTRSRNIEEMVLGHHQKKLVYVLNKADLVPKDVLAGWLAHLRQSHPAVPFKCNTQNQKSNLVPWTIHRLAALV
jgi:nuclear GTP-binding protein